MTDVPQPLSSDILEQQFGPTEVEVLFQDGHQRVIKTKLVATGETLEISFVRFQQTGTEAFPQIHSEIVGGTSMGKAFHKHGVAFRRQERPGGRSAIPSELASYFNELGDGQVLKVSITVGDEQLPYAEIIETYSPKVKWPERQPVVIIDNYDSFTYNLYQQVASLGYETKVFTHDAITIAELEALNPSHIIISPGPKRPENAGISIEVVKHFYKTVPLLGVCLGHQCIGEVFGSSTVVAPTIMHGKADALRHESGGLFENLPSELPVARYHSLVVDQVPAGFLRTAWSDDGSLMAMQHTTYPVFGVQFHPESFMTEHGEAMMRKFLQCRPT
jgi:anthranilate synthase component II